MGCADPKSSLFEASGALILTMGRMCPNSPLASWVCNGLITPSGVVCYTAMAQKKVKVKSCPTICDPMNCSPPGSSIHGTVQARILEWVAISFSRGSSWPRDRTLVSRIGGRCFNLWATREAIQCKLYVNSCWPTGKFILLLGTFWIFFFFLKYFRAAVGRIHRYGVSGYGGSATPHTLYDIHLCPHWNSGYTDFKTFQL